MLNKSYLKIVVMFPRSLYQSQFINPVVKCVSVCVFLRHDCVGVWEGPGEQDEAAAAARRRNGCAGVGHLTNRFIHAAAVCSSRSPAHAALTHPTSQVLQILPLQLHRSESWPFYQVCEKYQVRAWVKLL